MPPQPAFAAASNNTVTGALSPAFSDRMATIKTYQADESASTRLAVWQWTWEYAKTHPFGGGFEAYRQNRIRYDTVAVKGSGARRVSPSVGGAGFFASGFWSS